MIKSSVTVSLVPSLHGGPWIYWDDITASCHKAADTGFDAVELFHAAPDALSPDALSAALDETGLDLSAVGTGAGKVLHGLTLIDPDPSVRTEARRFISDMITFGSRFKAPAIIGSMQGNVGPDANRDHALAWLADGLRDLGTKAADAGVHLIYEPLNRYETNLFNRQNDAIKFLSGRVENVVLLCDLFHMNIEEASIGDALREAGPSVGYVHFADSNRRPIGFGHTDMTDIVAALEEIHYDGYVSAEAFAFPDPDTAASQTIQSFHRWFRERGQA